MCDEVFHMLQDAELDYAVFGSAAGAQHGFFRQAHDVDVFLNSTSLDSVLALLPSATKVPPNGLRCHQVEVWHAPLQLKSAERIYLMHFDDELKQRRLPDRRLGWVISPEDAFVIKATLVGRKDKSDFADAKALWKHWNGRLDLDYLARRAALCGAAGQVDRVLLEVNR